MGEAAQLVIHSAWAGAPAMPAAREHSKAFVSHRIHSLPFFGAFTG
jgi:hypothetical protein